MEAIRARTPARILVGRAGPAYPTLTQLELRRDHATAVDAVHAELRLESLGSELVERFELFQVQTRATSKAEYLVRPDLGRRLDDDSVALLRELCPAGSELQIVVGDGLSALA